MNAKSIILAGIMSALIGAMLGLAINYINQRESRRKIAVIGGASLGFILGAGSTAIRQNANESEDLGEEEPWK